MGGEKRGCGWSGQPLRDHFGRGDGQAVGQHVGEPGAEQGETVGFVGQSDVDVLAVGLVAGGQGQAEGQQGPGREALAVDDADTGPA